MPVLGNTGASARVCVFVAVGTAVAGTAVGRGAVALGVGVSVSGGVEVRVCVGCSVAVGEAVRLGSAVGVGGIGVAVAVAGRGVALEATVGVAGGLLQAVTKAARTISASFSFMLLLSLCRDSNNQDTARLPISRPGLPFDDPCVNDIRPAVSDCFGHHEHPRRVVAKVAPIIVTVQVLEREACALEQQTNLAGKHIAQRDRHV